MVTDRSVSRIEQVSGLREGRCDGTFVSDRASEGGEDEEETHHEGEDDVEGFHDDDGEVRAMSDVAGCLFDIGDLASRW